MPIRFVLILVGCLLTTRLAPESLQASDDPRREVLRLHDQSLTATKQNQPRAALDAANKAATLARQKLGADDPVRARVVREHLRLSYEHYLARGKKPEALACAFELFIASQAEPPLASSWATKVETLVAALPASDPSRGLAGAQSATYWANIALQKGDRGTARRWAAAAVDRSRAALPEGSPVRVLALITLADLDSQGGQSSEALANYQRAATEARVSPDQNADAWLATSLSAAGSAVENDRPLSPELADDLAVISRALKNKETLLPILDVRIQNLAEALLMRARREGTNESGVAAAAEHLSRDVSQLRDAWTHAGLPASAIASTGLAEVQFLHERRRLTAADSALRTIENDLKAVPESESNANASNYRGLIELDRANIARARQSFETAIRIWKKLGLWKAAIALANLGQLELRQGDARGASNLLSEADQLFESSSEGRSSLAHAFALRNLADARDALEGNPDNASLRLKALHLAEAADPPDPFAIYLVTNSIATASYRQGRFSDAAKSFEASRKIAISAFGAGHFHVAEAEVNLGWIALRTGHLAEATSRFEAAKAALLASLGRDHPRHAEVLGYLARINARVGKTDEARRLLDEALDLRETYLDRLLRTSYSERDRLALVQELRVHPESRSWPGTLDTFLELAPTLNVSPMDQYRRILAWKGVLARPLDGGVESASRDPRAADLIAKRAAVLQRLRDAVFLDTKGESIRALEREEESLEREISRLAPASSKGLREVPDPTAIQRALGPDSALLDIIEVRRLQTREEGTPQAETSTYVAILMRREGNPIRLDLGDARTINGQVDQLLESLINFDDVPTASAPLSKSLRDPLLPHLSGIKLLIVSADGRLHRIPMGALPGRGGPGTFWVQDLAFISIGSARTLVAPRPRSTNKNDAMVIVGGVDYGPPTRPADKPSTTRGGAARLYTQWNPLVATADEAQETAEAFKTQEDGKLTLLTGAEATKEKLADALDQSRFAHIATHGFYDASNDSDSDFDVFGLASKFDSYLVLAGANQGNVQMLLTAEEVGRMDLRGLELIVLSACESGLGRVRAGQGTAGLLEGFERAGAGAVLVSLWEIDDVATRSFMRLFYAHLWSRDRPLAAPFAVQAAQIDMLRAVGEDAETLRHPKSWATFILSGDPARLTSPEP